MEKSKRKQISENNNGAPFVSEYFRYEQSLVDDVVSHKYFYDGKLISKSNRNKDFDQLTEGIQIKILTAVAEIQELYFTNILLGIHFCRIDNLLHYCRYSINKVEIFAIDLNDFKSKLCDYGKYVGRDAINEYERHHHTGYTRLVFDDKGTI